MNYTQLIKEAWRFVWRRKGMPALAFTSMSASVLADLALYAALVGVILGVPAILERLMGIPAYMLADWPASRWGIPVAAVGLLLWPLIWLVGLAARGGMIAMVDADEDGRRLSFGGALGRGLRFSPRLAAMSFLLHLPAIGLILVAQLVLLMMIPTFVNTPPDEVFASFATFYALSISLSCLSYGVLFFLQFIYAFAYRAVVMEDRGVMGSIGQGWRVLRQRAGDIIPLAMIFLGVALLLVIIWYAAFFVIYFVLLFGAVAGGMEQPSPLFIVLVVVALLGFTLLSLIVGAIQAAWRSAAFTKAYRYWTGKAADEPTPPDKTEFLL